MAILDSHQQHLLGEGWTAEQIQWAAKQEVRSIDSKAAERLNISCLTKDDGLVYPAGLFFPYGEGRILAGKDKARTDNTATWGQVRCDDRLIQASGKPAPKYLPTRLRWPVPWAPNGDLDACLAFTEGWKDAAASHIRFEIPIAGIGAPSYYRKCFGTGEDQHGVAFHGPFVLDADTPFVMEVWRTLVACAVEQSRLINHIPWMPEHPKGGMTEWIFQAGATEQDVMNLIGAAMRPQPFLFHLLKTWTDATDEQWAAANKNARMADVPRLKARNAEQLAKTAALALSEGEAATLLKEAAKLANITKADLMRHFTKRLRKVRSGQRAADTRRLVKEGKPVYEVDASNTIELALTRNLTLESAGDPLAANTGKLYRYRDALGFWELQSDSDVHKLITDQLPRYFSIDHQGTPRYDFATTPMEERCFKWLTKNLHRQIGEGADYIAFSNGAFNLRTREMEPHSSDHNLTYVVGGRFNKRGELPEAFGRFLATSFNGPEWIPIVRSVIRYIIDPTLPAGKCVVVIGPSGSGKGVMERVLLKLFPPACVSGLQKLSQLKSPETLYQNVLGRRLISFGDLQGHEKEVSAFYQLVDGAPMTARKLHSSDTVTFNFGGRIVICSTQMPTFDDAGTGWERRALMLNTIQPTVKEPGLEDAIQKEIGAIASWALQDEAPMDIVFHDRTNAPNETLVLAKQETEANVDSVRSFINACLAPSRPADHQPDPFDLFNAYRAFCWVTGSKPCRQNEFINRLRNNLLHLHIPRRNETVAEAEAAGRARDQRQKIPARFEGFLVIPSVWSSTIKQAVETFADLDDDGDGVDRETGVEFSVHAYDDAIERKGFVWEPNGRHFGSGAKHGYINPKAFRTDGYARLKAVPERR